MTIHEKERTLADLMNKSTGRENAKYWINGDILWGRRIFRNSFLQVTSGRIASSPGDSPTDGADVLDFRDGLVLPGLVEMHLHGALEADFGAGNQSDNRRIAAYLASQGITGFMAAIISSTLEETERAVDRLVEDFPMPGGPRLLGIFFEGPFINPGKRGAHRLSCLRYPDKEHFDRLVNRVPGHLKTAVLLAPELPGASELARHAKERGTVVALGHSQADYNTGRRAIRAGARYGVHLFNCMPPMHHRNPGLAGALLDDRDAFIEIIPDLVHVHAAMVRLAIKAKGISKTALVTDLTGPAGMPEGSYFWDGRHVTVRRRATRLDDGTLAGSNLANRSLFLHMRALGCKLPDIVRMRSAVPATILGLRGRYGVLKKGRPANITVLNKDMSTRATICDGNVVYRQPR